MSARDRLAAARMRLRGKVEPVQRTITAFMAGAIVGELERRTILPADIMSLPTKPVLVLACHALGGNAGMGKHILNAAPGIAGAYGYAAAKAGTLVAGDDMVELG